MSIFQKILLAIVIILLTSLTSAATEPLSGIRLTATDIRNDKGFILITLFNQQEGFPSDSTKAYRSYVLEAQSPAMQILIDKLPAGEYALAIVHDENRNLKLDTNLVGAPVEGYASSGTNKRFSAPKFETSKFTIGKESLRLDIKINYLF